MNSVSIELRRFLDKCRKLVHKHNYDITGAKEIKVDLIGEEHTVFMVLECKCGAKMAFPPENYILAVNYGTDETLQLLERLGIEHG